MARVLKAITAIPDSFDTSFIELWLKCISIFAQLEEKLKEKVDPELAEKIDLNGEQDVFHRWVASILKHVYIFKPVLNICSTMIDSSLAKEDSLLWCLERKLLACANYLDVV